LNLSFIYRSFWILYLVSLYSDICFLAGLGKVTEAAKTTTQVKNTNGMEVDDDEDEDEQEADEAGSGSENDDAGDAVADSSAEGDQLVIA
jgi:hypothetical protein